MWKLEIILPLFALALLLTATLSGLYVDGVGDDVLDLHAVAVAAAAAAAAPAAGGGSWWCSCG